jgi:hypothetical protein
MVVSSWCDAGEFPPLYGQCAGVPRDEFTFLSLNRPN